MVGMLDKQLSATEIDRLGGGWDVRHDIRNSPSY